MYLEKRIVIRWSQFRDEVAGLIRGLQLLIVNLALIGKFRPVGLGPITVIVDSWSEAAILWLLWVTRLMPRHKILVVRRTIDLNLSVQSNFSSELLLIVTSRTFTKHYQLLADLRRQKRLIVL